VLALRFIWNKVPYEYTIAFHSCHILDIGNGIFFTLDADCGYRHKYAYVLLQIGSGISSEPDALYVLP
jgi:hypothetical protein